MLVARDDVEIDVGMEAGELRAARDHVAIREVVGAGDAQAPGQPRVAPRHAALDLGELLGNGLGPGQKLLARRRQRYAAGPPIEEPGPEAGLQRGEPARHGRLVDAKPVRRPGQRAGADDGVEDAQVVPVHPMHYCMKGMQTRVLKCKIRNSRVTPGRNAGVCAS